MRRITKVFVATALMAAMMAVSATPAMAGVTIVSGNGGGGIIGDGFVSGNGGGIISSGGGFSDFVNVGPGSLEVDGGSPFPNDITVTGADFIVG